MPIVTMQRQLSDGDARAVMSWRAVMTTTTAMVQQQQQHATDDEYETEVDDGQCAVDVVVEHDDGSRAEPQAMPDLADVAMVSKD